MAFPLKSSRVKSESESGKCVEEVFQNGDRDIRRKAHPHYKEFMIDNIDPKTQYPKELGGFQMGRPMKWAHLPRYDIFLHQLHHSHQTHLVNLVILVELDAVLLSEHLLVLSLRN